ncbi:MAG TPA: dUTP diphosphatase, partial [Thermodesulfobacteriota bacterium]|nr:dUTP diphosphatase [Thermodesulfobacteriota bacterium]
MKIYLKRLRKNPPAALPEYMTPGASGMDLFASLDKEITLEPGERRIIPTGIAVAIP